MTNTYRVQLSIWRQANFNDARALGYSIEWHQYPMQHQVAPEEIEAIGKWLNRTLGD